MNGLTVKDLLRECQRAIRNGYGNKIVLISQDDEGNGFHTLWYGLQCDKKEVKETLEWCPAHDDNDADDVVLLG